MYPLQRDLTSCESQQSVFYCTQHAPALTHPAWNTLHLSRLCTCRTQHNLASHSQQCSGRPRRTARSRQTSIYQIRLCPSLDQDPRQHPARKASSTASQKLAPDPVKTQLALGGGCFVPCAGVLRRAEHRALMDACMPFACASNRSRMGSRCCRSIPAFPPITFSVKLSGKHPLQHPPTLIIDGLWPEWNNHYHPSILRRNVRVAHTSHTGSSLHHGCIGQKDSTD